MQAEHARTAITLQALFSAPEGHQYPPTPPDVSLGSETGGSLSQRQTGRAPPGSETGRTPPQRGPQADRALQGQRDAQTDRAVEAVARPPSAAGPSEGEIAGQAAKGRRANYTTAEDIQLARAVIEISVQEWCSSCRFSCIYKVQREPLCIRSIPLFIHSMSVRVRPLKLL